MQRVHRLASLAAVSAGLLGWAAAPHSADAAKPQRLVAVMTAYDVLPCGDQGGHFGCGTDDRIVTLSSNGGRSRALVRRETLDYQNRYSGPAWSPDGRQIAFMDGQRPAIMRDDGKRRHVVGPCCFDSVAWSHDRRWLLAAGSLTTSSLIGIYRLSTDGRKLRRLTSGGDVDAHESVNGTIAFVRDRTPDHPWIYIRTRRGTVRPLTPGRSPAWSPGGRTIAYVRGYSIFTIAANGRHRHRLTRDHNDADPAWSPTGKSIAFVRFNRQRISLISPHGVGLGSVGPKAGPTLHWAAPSWRPSR